MSAVTLVMVLFAGVVGPQSDRAERQLSSLLHHDAKVEPTKLSPADEKALATHSDRAERVVRHLHTNGVVAGEVIYGKHGKRLRVYVYDGDGNVISQVEVPLNGDSLTRSGISMLREAVVSDVVGLSGGDAKSAPSAVAEDDTDAAPVEKHVDKRPAKHTEKKPAHHDDAADEAPAQARDDDDTPAALAGNTPAAAASDETPASEAPAVDDTALNAVLAETPLHMAASVGFGFISRSFSPNTGAMEPYTAMAVGAVRFQGDIEPAPRVRLDFLGESSLGMVTALDEETAPTKVTRWQVEASWAALHGRFSLAPGIGVGRRWFSILSKDPDRSPDGDYLYVVAGLRAGLAVGKRSQFTALARIEPCVGGDQPTESLFGQAARVGYDFELALDVPFGSWLMARAEAGVQSFSWSFAAGGGATDTYAGATFSLGATY